MTSDKHRYIERHKAIRRYGDDPITEEIQTGDILIGHRLLITSALLLEKKLRLDEGRLLDFCTLLNAISLYDRLVTLPAFLPEEIRESALYKFLIKKRILYEYSANIEGETKKELEDFFGAKVSKEEALKSKWIHYDMRFDRETYDFYDEHQSDARDINTPRREFIKEVIRSRRNSRGSLNWNDQTYRNILKEDNIRPFRIRTAAYWLIPGIAPISFLPDFFRIPLITEYNIRLAQIMDDKIRTQSVRLFIEKKAQDSLRKKLRKFWPFANPKPIPIPNAALTFLDSYSSSSSLEETLESLRERFQSHKKDIVKWETMLRNPEESGYGGADKAIDEMSTSLEAVEKTDQLQGILSIGMAATRDLIHLSPGTNTASAVAQEIFDRMRNQKQRKKLSYVYSGKKLQYNIKNRSKLLEKIFGSTLTNTQRYNFFILTEYLDDLITVSTP